MNIKQIVRESLVTANSMPVEGSDDGLINRSRSKNFVESLADRLRQHYLDRKGLFVLSKHHDKHRLEFGLNELLYDVLVCETNQVESPIRHEVLTYVTKAIWQIESEFAHDSRQAMYDFNKLVLGSSENKLFIGPQDPDEGHYLGLLAEPAQYCGSSVFVALVPHPADWKPGMPDVHCWQFKSGWQPYE